MQVTETNTDGLKREFKILVPAADIEEQMSNRLKQLAGTVNMPGFRPGKVPVNLLRKKYGPTVLGEVLEKAVNETSQQTMSERGLRPALQPQIEISKFEDGSDLEYTMAVEVMPEIEPMDFSSLKLERMVVDMSDAEMDKALERLASAQKTTAPLSKKRKSKNGDALVIDFVGRVDGEEFPGGKAESYTLDLGSGSFIPGFEDQLIGVDAGDQVEVKVAFPKDYGAENLAGKDAVFDVTVKEILEQAPAAIDDELAAKLGMVNLETLKEQIHENHSQEYKKISRMRLKRSLLDQLADMIDFDIPAGLVEQEFDAIWGHFEEQKKAGGQGLDPEDLERSDEENKAEFRSISERRVRLGLFLAEIGRLNNIQVGQDDLNKAMMEESRRHPGEEQVVFDYYRKNPEAMQSLSAPIYEDKVVDFVFEMAEVSDKKVTVEELLAEPEEKKPATKAKTKTKTKAKKKTAKKK